MSAQRLAELTALVASRVSTGHVSRYPAARLKPDVEGINQQIGTAPFTRLQLQLAPIVEAARRVIRDGTPSPELVGVATDAFSMAARFAFETGDDGSTAALYDEAVAVARLSSDRDHRAAVKTSYTMVVLHGFRDLAQARRIAVAAVKDAHQGPSYAVRARAHAVHAEICARSGQKREAATALARAWKTVDQLAVDDPHPGFNADRLNGFQGLCALHIGEAHEAHDLLARSVAALGQPRDIVQRGINTSDLALARLRLGDPVACTALLHTAVDITASTGGWVAAHRLREVRRQLRPWRTEAFVADLDDHIYDSLIGR